MQRPTPPAWVADARRARFAGLHDHRALGSALRRVHRRSGGAVAVEPIGATNEGRELWCATAGSGPTRVLYVTQQHGDEPLATEAALRLLQRIASAQAPWARDVLDRVTLRVVPRANPDGAERRQRHNADPGAEGADGEPGVGYDVNRYHDPALALEANPVPEAAAVQRLVRAWRPEITVDYHHQDAYRQPDGSLDTTSLLWPTSPDVDPDVVAASKRLAAVVFTALEGHDFARVTRFPGESLGRIARNSFGLLGSATLLVELRGDLDPRSGRVVMRAAYAAMASLLVAAGDGSLATADPAVADAIPPRGDPVDHDGSE